PSGSACASPAASAHHPLAWNQTPASPFSPSGTSPASPSCPPPSDARQRPFGGSGVRGVPAQHAVALLRAIAERAREVERGGVGGVGVPPGLVPLSLALQNRAGADDAGQPTAAVVR